MTSAPTSPPRRYRFADLTLDTGQRRLWRGDEEIRLSKLSFDFLRALVEAAPNLLTPDAIVETVWGPRRVITPENLSQRLMVLREAIGEEAERPRYIEAVRGQGYRLIPDVEAIETARIANAEPPRAAPAGRAGLAPPRKTLLLIYERRHTPLFEGANLIGRAADARVQIEFPGVSRYHARVQVAGDDAVIEDLGSKNGTLVNRQPIATPCRLADGDEILIGGAVVTFRITSAAMPTATIVAGNQLPARR
jgi:DNA-binding winged helix-turn-helix (wHTH) protein